MEDRVKATLVAKQARDEWGKERVVAERTERLRQKWESCRRQSQECFLLERMSVRVNAGKGRGGGWKVAGPGLLGGRSRWRPVTQQGEPPGGPTASFHSKGSHLFDQTYNFCTSCSKQSGISMWKSVTWMHENCWLPSTFLSSIPTHHCPTRGLICPSPQEMMGARRRCWLGQKTGILPNGDTAPELHIQKSFLCWALSVEGLAH